MTHSTPIPLFKEYLRLYLLCILFVMIINVFTIILLLYLWILLYVLIITLNNGVGLMWSLSRLTILRNLWIWHLLASLWFGGIDLFSYNKWWFIVNFIRKQLLFPMSSCRLRWPYRVLRPLCVLLDSCLILSLHLL